MTTTSTAVVKPAEFDELTEEELAALEPEERAALEEKTEDVTEGVVEEKKPKEEVREGDAEKKGDEKPTEEVKSEDEKPVEKEDYGVVDTENNSYRQTVGDVDEFSDTDYESEVEALAKKYEDGDITLSQHTIEAGKLNARKYDADSYESRKNQAEYDAWQADQRAFFASNKRFETSTILNSALDGEVKRLASLDDSPTTGAELLSLAARNVLKEMGQIITPVESNTTPRPSTPNKSPVTLSDAPSADSQPTSKDKFAAIDNLEGMELEAAVASLSDADRKLYES